MRDPVRVAVEQAAAGLTCSGVRALRVLLHAGLTAYWPTVRATPNRQLAAYETTLDTMRERVNGTGTTVCPDSIDIFQRMDDEGAAFLDACARLSGAQWLEPLDSLATMLVSVLYGTVLRWLADGNDETVVIVLDDLVGCLTLKAVDA